METFEDLVPLREFCRKNPWPRLAQWHHWIYSESAIAKACVKKVEGRYVIDVKDLEHYLRMATLEELQENTPVEDL